MTARLAINVVMAIDFVVGGEALLMRVLQTIQISIFRL
jgi:hypothetical protein